MDVFETFAKTITDTSQAVAEKAKLVAEILKVKDQIRSNKKEIRILTYKIGQAYLDLHENDPDADFSDYIRGIKEAKESMENKKDILSELKAQIKFGDFEGFDDDDLSDILNDDAEEATSEAMEEEITEAVEESAEEPSDSDEAAIEEAAEEETSEESPDGESAE